MSGIGRLTRGRRAPVRGSGRRAGAELLEHRTAQLEAQVTALETRNEALEAFAATAAHQLAEPLIVVESSAIMVAEDLAEPADVDLRDRVSTIGTVAARARRQTEVLLLDARTADQPPELAPVDVARVLDDVLAQLAPRIAKRRVRVDIGAMPVVPSERGLLSVVFENLLANALKYGPRTGGRVGIEAERAPGGGWCFQVTSEGTPIAGPEAAHLFEPFRRGSGERRSTGFGLGLAICQRVVGRLGGTIGVTPLARGNAFHFTLPTAA